MSVEAVDGDLIDNVKQQEGHAHEAQGLQQAPRVAWRTKKQKRSQSLPQL